MIKKPKIIVILGPTATGKSNLAVRLAKKFGGEIVSADSRQVYKGLDIGTGKVTKKEMAGVPHHLLDVASPKRQFTAAQFKEKAGRAIQDVLHRGKVPILVGGTGFYIDTVLGTVSFPEVPPDTALRRELETKPIEELLKKLEALDPERAETIERANPRRIIRAIEIARALGKVPRLTKRNEHYDAFKIGLTLPDKELKERIAIRLFTRIRDGMIAEAKRLHAKGLSWKRMRELGLEYRFLADHLTGSLNREEFEEGLRSAIWHYAKRQMRWFKRDDAIQWFTLSSVEGLKSSEFVKIEQIAKSFLSTESD
ncbi:MAG: tRNA (adenosine(37)-N6)-dimethylallyltransferase MiaA [Parcubacteria group bacterium]|nr:tRNA (adenosine(37)-N6)-dimethylallyltransferase MiaA [Parcubacteria group bacterium]